MPELNLNRKGDVLTVTGVPGETKPAKIHYPSDETKNIIFEAAEELEVDPNVITDKLFARETVDF